MSRYLINLVVFLVGLAAAGWIGAGYVGSNPLALGVTLLIALFYMAGAFELYRYGRATSGLRQAVAGLEAPPRWPAGSTPCRPACATPPGCASKASAPPCPAPRSRPTWSACWSCWACSAPSWVWWSRWAPAWRWKAPPTCTPSAPRWPRRSRAWASPSAPRSPASPPRPCWACCPRLPARPHPGLAAVRRPRRHHAAPLFAKLPARGNASLLQRQADAMPALAERLQAGDRRRRAPGPGHE